MMTKILYFPSESAFYTLETNLQPGRLVLAVNGGHWRPPPETHYPQRHKQLRAVRLGRSTVLIFWMLKGEALNLAQVSGETLGMRSMEVLQCVAQGMTVRQVAAHLGLSRRTVYLHLAAIRRNYNATSTAEAVRRAAELGLCQLPDPDKAK